ncbi:hypothetical protein BDN70DRAFT_932597 [Pholiota conissans]|uniref:Uncharacterized protein n=1 Tax=Pholiota conissans TaxID=109636 RepID=A0A9P5Z370_9AGAR|nr:hypothetical protein BDN70DRAFT_932597 [Pholiota conissans]
MRFNVLLAVTFIATSAAGLVIPSNDFVEARDLDFLDDATVVRREPMPEPTRDSRHPEASRQHRQTTGLPPRRSTFHVPAAPSTGRPAHTYTGHDVRKAVFDGHMEHERLKGASNRQKKLSPLKSFGNRLHELPHPGGSSRPLSHMTVHPGSSHHPHGREFPLPNHHNPGQPSPARVITQKTQSGHHTFRGVIAHDQSRTPGTGNGYNDHFQVPAHKPRRSNTGYF